MTCSDPVPRGCPTRLVLFHGLASTPKEFGFLVHPLRRQGVTLQAPELPGYSGSMLAMEPRWQDWLDAAAARVAALAAESPGPYVLGGLCTGAMLAAALGASRPLPGLCGLAMLSPLVAYDGWALPRWYALRRVAYATGLTRFFSMAERPPYGLKNDRMRQWIRQQLAAGEATMVGPARVPLRHVRESERLSAHALGLLPGLRQPVQAQHAREDEICSLRSARRALAAVPTGLLSLHVLEDSYHMIAADNDRHRVADRLAAFMQGLAPTTPDAPARAPLSEHAQAGRRLATTS